MKKVRNNIFEIAVVIICAIAITMIYRYTVALEATLV